MNTTTAPDPYVDRPGTKNPFSIANIARATAKLLGDDWSADSCYWGVTGSVSGPFITSFAFHVDEDDDLCIAYDPMKEDAFPEAPALPYGIHRYSDGVYLESASPADGLKALAERSAAAIRAITGRSASAPTPITRAVKTEIEELLDRWSHAVSESGNNDDEHDIGVDMADLLRRLHKDLPSSR